MILYLPSTETKMDLCSCFMDSGDLVLSIVIFCQSHETSEADVLQTPKLEQVCCSSSEIILILSPSYYTSRLVRYDY